MHPTAPSIGPTWVRIERWCAAHAPLALATLRPGATEAALRAAEAQLGHPLPPDVRASYALHDGCASDYMVGGKAFLFGCAFLSLERMLETWTYQNGLFYGPSGPVADDARAAYALVRWHPSLVPVTHDWGGNHFCVDLSGALSGQAGQIIDQWHDSDEWGVYADSFAAWLAQYATELEQGRYVYLAEHGLTEDV